MTHLHQDAQALDRLGAEAIKAHFGITRQAISYWRRNGVPDLHRKTLCMIGALAGHEMTELMQPRKTDKESGS